MNWEVYSAEPSEYTFQAKPFRMCWAKYTFKVDLNSTFNSSLALLIIFDKKFQAIGKAQCTAQEGFREAGEDHAPCRKVSGKPEVAVHHAGWFPVSRRGPHTVQEGFRKTGEGHALYITPTGKPGTTVYRAINFPIRLKTYCTIQAG